MNAQQTRANKLGNKWNPSDIQKRPQLTVSFHINILINAYVADSNGFEPHTQL